MADLRKKISSNKGMSIIELLLVMAISLMILTMVVISYNVVNNANTTKAAKRMENVLKAARVAAMSRGQKAGIVDFKVENGRLFAYTGTGTADEKKELICNANVVVSVSDTEGLPPVIGDTSVGGTVAFDTNGRVRTARTDAYYFILSKGEKAYKVVVSKYTGAVECGLYHPGGGDGEGEGEGEGEEG